jgi:hypothetical protein
VQKWLAWAWPKPDEQRSIWIEVIKASLIFIGGSLVLCLGGWLTNQGPLLWRAITGSISVPVWFVILLATGSAGALLGLFRLYRKPAYVRHYREDWIDGIHWVWSYDDQYQIIKALPRCLKCETELSLTLSYPTAQMPGPGGTSIYCPTCNQARLITGTFLLKEDHALPKIGRKIFTGEWKQATKPF